MEKTVLIDTNLYLDDPNIIYKLAKDFDKILLPITVLKEIDKKKYTKDLSYSARAAIRSILDFQLEFPDQVEFDPIKHPGEDNDDRILACAKKYGATVASKDINMSIRAENMGLGSILHDVVLNNIYHPYVHVHMDDLHKETEEDVFAYDSVYEEEDDYERMLTVFSKLAGYELRDDSWFFVIIDVNMEEPIVYANNPLKTTLRRIDVLPKYREINVDGTLIKARDCYQICAIFALTEAPHCLITGRWGSGKTLISTAYALANNKKKAFITRAPLGINPRYDIGFLPGDQDEKMMNWLQGFMSALYFIYGTTRGSKDEKGRGYDHVRDTVFHQKFEILPMNSIQGLSLIDDDVLLVDEAQLITVDYMSMILSRPSETGKLVLLGDLGQTYDVVKPSESGLLKLLRVLPHKYMAYVELQNSYRSPLLEVADKLQDKSIS
jgi:PhoH-like ATPase